MIKLIFYSIYTFLLRLFLLLKSLLWIKGILILLFSFSPNNKFFSRSHLTHTVPLGLPSCPTLSSSTIPTFSFALFSPSLSRLFVWQELWWIEFSQGGDSGPLRGLHVVPGRTMRQALFDDRSRWTAVISRLSKEKRISLSRRYYW